MTDQERENKISSLAQRIRESNDHDVQQIMAAEMVELIKLRSAEFVAAMEKQMGLAA